MKECARAIFPFILLCTLSAIQFPPCIFFFHFPCPPKEQGKGGVLQSPPKVEHIKKQALVVVMKQWSTAFSGGGEAAVVEPWGTASPNKSKSVCG
jgi:hypothetical protein